MQLLEDLLEVEACTTAGHGQQKCSLCRLAVDAVGQATGHHRSGGNGFVIVSPQGVQVIETSAVVHDVSAERLWGGHTNHYVSGKFDRVATSDEESAHRLEQALATVGAAKAREMRDTGRFLVQSPGFVPGSPDGSVVTAFVLLADVELGSLHTAPGGGGKGPWISVALPRCDQSGRISTYPSVPCTRIR